MKIRQGFVSNSSSSSFIIVTKPMIVPDEAIEKYPALKVYQKIMEKLFGVSPLTKEEFLENFGYSTIEEMAEDYDKDHVEKIAKYFEEGCSIIEKEFEYGSGLGYSLMDIVEEDENVLMVWNLY